MFILGKESYSFEALSHVFTSWILILLYGGMAYSIMSLNAGHHGTFIVHEGDEFKSLDFGLYQVAATVDRVEATTNLFVRLTHFGEHVLHHLFPSIDHALLPHFRNEFTETCIEFKQEIRMLSMVDAAVEQYKQLARRETIKIMK
jgi:fatty acid desaturase